MFYFSAVIGMAVALWVFFDSQKHGYSVWRGLLWSIGVFFCLIVFLPLYLAVRKKKQRASALPTPVQEVAPLTPCFYCAQGYEGRPKVCPHCGQNLRF